MANEIIQSNEGDVVHARISKVMTVADQRALEVFAKRLIGAGRTIRLLVILEDFEGWERSEAWSDDLEFQLEHGNEIARIAIVGDEQWRDPALLFVGKGFRSTHIEFFPADALETAEAWIRSP